MRVSMRNRIDAAINSIGQGERPPSIAPQIYRLGFVLPSPGQLYGQPFADALRSAAHVSNAPIDVRIAHVEISSPLTAADLVRSMSAECHAISVTAALCPSLTDAIEEARSNGIYVVATGTPLHESGAVHYVGVDHWKVGRNAAWAFDHFNSADGTIGILLGHPRYRNQETIEAGFRSYFREYGRPSTKLQSHLTYDSNEVAQEMTENLIASHPNLTGLLVTSGALNGVMKAVKKTHTKLTVVSFGMLDVAWEGLIDGSVTLNMAPPVRRLANEVLAKLVSWRQKRGETGNSVVLPFETHTPENI